MRGLLRFLRVMNQESCIPVRLPMWLRSAVRPSAAAPTTAPTFFESTSNSTGGGLSQYEPIPSYQKGVTKVVGTQRGIPDVCAEAESKLWPLGSRQRQRRLVYRRRHQHFIPNLGR